MMIENNASAESQPEEEEINIEIVDDPAEGAQSSDGDELDRYTKSVSKRINKLNRKNREAEARAQQLEQLAYQKETELQQYRQYAATQQQTVLDSEEQKLAAQESQVNDIYQRAVSSNDAGLMSKADSLKTDIAIKKERLKTAKAQYAQQVQQQAQPLQQDASENYQAYQQDDQQAQEQARPEPTEEALDWHSRNQWFGDRDDKDNWEATIYARHIHDSLVSEGYDLDSEDYYGALDSRLKKAYPEIVGRSSADKQPKNGQRPAVQRVASSLPRGRAQTRGSRDGGVKFSQSELERLQRLKPHNMSEEVWLKRVALEKQKIAQREA
jgi:chemotaxis protein histidine kinase CheA